MLTWYEKIDYIEKRKMDSYSQSEEVCRSITMWMDCYQVEKCHVMIKHRLKEAQIM